MHQPIPNLYGECSSRLPRHGLTGFVLWLVFCLCSLGGFLGLQSSSSGEFSGPASRSIQSDQSLALARDSGLLRLQWRSEKTENLSDQDRLESSGDTSWLTGYRTVISSTLARIVAGPLHGRFTVVRQVERPQQPRAPPQSLAG